MRLAQDRSQSFSSSSWVARLEDLPFALVLDLPLTERRVSASVLRWPEEEGYVHRALKVWDEALKGSGSLNCDPRPSMVALEPPFLTRKYSKLSPAREQGERRGRQRDFLVSCNHQEFWKLDKANRAAYYPKVIPQQQEVEIPVGFAPSSIPFTWYFLDALTQASIKGFFHSIPYMMYTSEMTVLAANHWLHEVLVSNRLWFLPDLLMVWIVDKLTVDFLCSQDEEYKGLFQAMIDFRRLVPVHDRNFLNAIADQNRPRRDGFGWAQVVYQSSPAKVQLATPLPAWPQLGSFPAPAALDLLPVGPPVQESGWAAAVGQASAAAPLPPVAPVAPVASPEPSPARSRPVPAVPVLQAPPAPRLSAASLGVTVRLPTTPAAPPRTPSSNAGGAVPPLELGTPVSGAVVDRPVVSSSGRFEIPAPTLRLTRFRVPDWYLNQGGPTCDQYDVGMIEDQLGRLPVQVEGVGSSLVLGTYASVLNDVVDRVFACADSGQMSNNPVVGELLATLTRHGLAQQWSETFTGFQRRRRTYLDEREPPATTGTTPMASYRDAPRPPHYVIPSSSGSRRTAEATPEDTPAAQRPRRE